MERFSELLDRLYFTSRNLEKSALIRQYLAEVPDPDRGWAVAALGGTLSFDFFKRNLIRQLMHERADAELFEMAYDYVGETSETVAHMWPVSPQPVRLNRLPSLSEVVEKFSNSDKHEVRNTLIQLLDNMSPAQRWALLKLGTRGLRVGVSARFLKKTLAEYGGKPVEEIEKLWPALEPPYTQLLQWLEGKAEKPDIRGRVTFHPVMLSHPLEEADHPNLTPGEWQAEWKYDGIRVQSVVTPQGKALYSRTGDDISHSFPDIIELLGEPSAQTVLDGELMVMHDGKIGSFNELQQRLGRKKPTKKLITDYPAGLILYDALWLNGDDLTTLPLGERSAHLQSWIKQANHPQLQYSEPLSFASFEELEALREQTQAEDDSLIEGLMLKRLASPYIPGRPKGHWYKWKRDPRYVDAVMMYAQRGSGRRSSFYSDYTFGLWQGEEVIPIGKAYSGFSDSELKKLDKWVRNHTINRFGPVREVEKALVLEIAFDSARRSARHKSGLALRFPRIYRIRWDKPASEADQLAQFKALHRIGQMSD